MTARLFQAPAPRPVGSELRCHSQLFIRLHIHSLSITVWPPGPVTSLYVYYSVPPSPRRMIDVFGEQRGGTCALLLQSRLGGGRRLFHPHSDPESVTRRKRNNNSWWFVSQTIAGKLGAFRRVTISSLSGGVFMRGAPRVPLLIRLGAFDAHCRFLLLLLAVQEWPESKAAIQIRFHLNQLEEKEREREGTQNRERERETVCQPPSSQIQKILPRKKEECRG